MASTVKYGGYSLIPAPLLKISKTYIKSPDGINRGVTFSTTLSGTLVTPDGNAGFKNLMAKQRELREAFNKDGLYFEVTCDTVVVLECYPRIVNIELSEGSNNWTQQIPYTITLEYENDPANVGIASIGEDDPHLHPQFISDFQEDWQVEFASDESNTYKISADDQNPYVMRCTHNVSAVGKTHYEKPGSGSALIGELPKLAWEQARDYVKGRLGFDQTMFLSNSGLNLPAAIWAEYDHYRVQSVGVSSGSFAIQESWVVLGNTGEGARKVIEDFSVSVQTGIDQELDSISIEGSIQGLEERTYGNNPGEFAVITRKYDNAKDYWVGLQTNITNRILNIAALHNISDINSIKASGSVSHAMNTGVITYSQVYNNRPSNCIVGARAESITVSDSNPTDVFASLTVMGRANGPILQGFNTKTGFTRTVNIEVLMSRSNSCDIATLIADSPTTQVAAILCQFETDLNGTYDRVFKSADSPNWSPKTGRYSRSITWTCGACSNPPPDSGPC